ncbi:hypothetical protein [[Clostridium] fimetarium]|uniref:Uncharacterized protein n=1 Tax=[Clostridium] fimetarium TaxID=99656 RepID=A0A1I0MZH5_9FIRM|nr:hypothetical protein [[Clostridium] fimetarium]SEV93506.1 hypothetical protein SAMN05421659_102231 [[Clostridium] fimetarium]
MDNYSLGWWDRNEDGSLVYINGAPNLMIGDIISDQDKEALDLSFQILNEFISFHSYYIYVNRNIEDLLEVLYKVSDKSLRLTNDMKLEYAQEIGRLLNNSVMQLFVYINYFECTLKDKNLEKFKMLANKYYDEYWEYRFLYQLRNFITHRTLPSISISSNIINAKRIIKIDAKHLLNNYTKWKQVKNDLEKQIEGVDIIDLFEKTKDMVIKFHKEAILIKQGDLTKGMVFIQRFLKIKNGCLEIPVIIDPYTEEKLKKGIVSWSTTFRCFETANKYLIELNIEEISFGCV